MSNELTVPQEKSHRDIIKEMYFKDSSDAEFEAFMMLCHKTKLDPVAKQIYAVKSGSKINTIVAIDGYRLIAERTGKYVPGREPTYTYNEKGALISATCYVKKQAGDGSWHEVGATALLSEYKKSAPIWTSMPHVMLAKCAESLALRRAFPNDLSGLHTEDEMGISEGGSAKKPQLMTKQETIEVQELPKLEQRRHSIEELMKGCGDITGEVKKATLLEFVAHLVDQHNAKGGRKVCDVDIIESAFLPGQMERFAELYLQFVNPVDEDDLQDVPSDQE